MNTSPFDHAIPEVLNISQKSWKQNIAFYTVATLFSAVHLGAWNWNFPSTVSRILWRVFAIYATAAGPFFVVALLVLKIRFTGRIRLLATIRPPLAFFLEMVAMPLYVICRCALFGLVFYSFSSMPTGVYKTIDWTSYFPFLS